MIYQQKEQGIGGIISCFHTRDFGSSSPNHLGTVLPVGIHYYWYNTQLPLTKNNKGKGNSHYSLYSSWNLKPQQYITSIQLNIIMIPK